MSRQRPGACRRRERRLRTAVDQLASAVQVIALFAESLRKSIHVSRADAAHLHGSRAESDARVRAAQARR